MSTLLIPGRHLITSQFMVDYLETILSTRAIGMEKVGLEIEKSIPIDQIVFLITSANQQGSRYNPVPLYARIIGLERTVATLREKYRVHISYVPIPHLPTTQDFAASLIKYAEAHLRLSFRPEEAVIWTSTPSLIANFHKNGYTVLPAELDMKTGVYHAAPPNTIIEELAKTKDYDQNSTYSLLSNATRTLWSDMPEIPAHIFRLWNEPLLTESGSLTETRDYSTYAVGMSHSEIMDVKFNDIRGGVLEGKIVDEGCADGAMMVRLAEAFPDSDIIGIDITGEFISRVEERQRAGEFKKSFVFAYQRNLLQPIFEENSINTTICNSTLHEIWSYGSQEQSLLAYLEEKYRQLMPGGRLVIRDVVGPENKNETVYLELSTTDGLTLDLEDTEALLSADTRTLSTESLLYRFKHNFLNDLCASGRRDTAAKIQFVVEYISEIKYFRMKMKDAFEFLSKKDYHDNWKSEMNEEFGFWSITEWTDTLTDIGFTILQEDSIEPRYSRAYVSDWIVKNRWKDCVHIYKKVGEELVSLPYPVTTMVLVAQK